MKKEYIYAYIAGIFDGEGCVGIFGKKKKEHQLMIVSTDINLIKFVQKEMNCGWITQHKTPLNKPHYKQRYDFRLAGRIKIKKFLMPLYPYLIIKKEIAKRFT